MLANDVFSATFGISPSGDPDKLARVITMAVRAGFAIVLNEPGGKNPLCTLTARERKAADTAVQDAARDAGDPKWTKRRHQCAIYHTITDEDTAKRVVPRMIKTHSHVNTAVNVGSSLVNGRKLLCVDVDTAAQKAAFLATWSEAAGQDMSGHTPTVISPGLMLTDKDGTENWVHKDGGHLWFRLPEGVDFTTADTPGSLTDETGEWVVIWGNKQVLTPPSVRAEGPYQLVGQMTEAPEWLVDRVWMTVRAHVERTRIHAEKFRTGRHSGIDVWAASTPWADLLAPDGWIDTGLPDTCDCPIWTAPGSHSHPKSATAHEPGCGRMPMDSGHGPLHVWTDNPPQFLRAAQRPNFTKLQYVSFRDHDGNDADAVRVLGIDPGPAEEIVSDPYETGEPPDELDTRLEPDVEPDDVEPAVEPTVPARLAGRPRLHPDAMYGLAGDVVRALDPTTEADPAAVLFAFLAAAGCYLGPGPHYVAGAAGHPGRIWPILTGHTSTGKKGTATAVVEGLMRRIDDVFMVACRANGLSSSEGLIKRVRDDAGNPDSDGFDPGVTDKRLLITEPEFASVLSRARREGNSLSATLRDAYDGVTLQTLVSANPMRSTGHHITVISMITPGELIEKLSATDVTNGFANRFMIVYSERSKSLPEDAEPDPAAMVDIQRRFNWAKQIADQTSRMRRTEPARKLWAEEYARFENRGSIDGPIAAMFARWAPHATRLSVIYALLDGSAVIDEVHVRASLAAWRYVEQSVRHVFGDASHDTDLGRVIEFIDDTDIGCVRRTDVSIKLFNRNKSKHQLDELRDKLAATSKYEILRKPRTDAEGNPLRGTLVEWWCRQRG